MGGTIWVKTTGTIWVVRVAYYRVVTDIRFLKFTTSEFYLL